MHLLTHETACEECHVRKATQIWRRRVVCAVCALRLRVAVRRGW